MALLFMWAQVVLCLGGSVGYMLNKQWAMAWIWFCYASANLGFVNLAGGFK